MYLATRSQDYFELFGVEPSASFDQLKRAFLERCDRFSPMAFRDRALDAHGERLEEIFLLLVRAFSTLAVPSARREYVDRVRAQGEHGGTALARVATRRSEGRRNAFAVDEPAKASPVVKTAITFINTGQPAAAIGGLRDAVRAEPGDAEALALLGYASYLADPVSRRADAIKCLQRAMATDSRCLHAFLFLGRIFELEQDRANALGAYRECLRIERLHAESLEAIERLEQLLGAR
jgi:tetratricopeptide (TPR) repeat protein